MAANLRRKTGTYFNKFLERCPTCKEPWMEGERNQLPDDPGLKKFLRLIRELRTIERTFGCELSLEIKGDGITPASSVHVSSAKD
jgi:hypothetical protein